MRNRFNINEEEKNRIKGLHGIKVITEQKHDLYLIKKEDIPQESHDCVTFKEMDDTRTGKGTYANCKYGKSKLPIGNKTVGDYLTIEDCCKQKPKMGLNIDEQDDILRDEEGNPRPGDGCAAKNLCDDPNNPGECIECEEEEIVDDEITDEEIVDAPDDEDSWLEERWEDLTDAVRNVFRRSKHFAGCSGPGSCPGFNKTNRRRKKRILRAISLSFPRIKWPRFVIHWPKIRFKKLRGRGDERFRG